MCCYGEQKSFQSTLPRGERQAPWHFGQVFALFQSTLPRGERQRLAFCIVVLLFHFNPRSREGSDGNIHENICSYAISIHAPARGATLIVCTSNSYQLKFQSTLPRGERQRLAFCIVVLVFHFNPRSREGSDGRVNYPACLQNISIHAPARGATISGACG